MNKRSEPRGAGTITSNKTREIILLTVLVAYRFHSSVESSRDFDGGFLFFKPVVKVKGERSPSSSRDCCISVLVLPPRLETIL